LGSCKDIWIYKLKAGNLIEVPAFIFVDIPESITTIAAYDRDNKNYLMQVPNGEGYIFGSTLWYSKQDFKKAKDTFLYELNSRIADHYERMEELRHLEHILEKQKGAK